MSAGRRRERLSRTHAGGVARERTAHGHAGPFGAPMDTTPASRDISREAGVYEGQD